MTSLDPTARLGTVVGGRWTLEALLGEGGVGCVYRGRQSDGNVAIKVLHGELRQERAWLHRMEREARLANMVEHPAVVRVLDSGALEDGTPFLVGEFVDGETLEELREQDGGALPLDEVLSAADTLLGVLDRAHRKRIVHRDIKPANLMRTPTGEVRILDFGLAREVGAAGGGLTNEGAIVGTVGFMAPEQAQGRWDLVDAGTDLWAVGATILKLATGLDVHEAETPQMQLALAATKSASPIGARAPELPAHVAAALDRALSFSKQHRFPNAVAFRRALLRGEQAGETEPAVEARPSVVAAEVAVVAATTIDAIAPASSRKRTWIGATAALAVAMTGALGARAYLREAPAIPSVPASEASAGPPIAANGAAESDVAAPGPVDGSHRGQETAALLPTASPPTSSPPSVPPSSRPPTRGTKRPSAAPAASASIRSSRPVGSPPLTPETPANDDILDRRR